MYGMYGMCGAARCCMMHACADVGVLYMMPYICPICRDACVCGCWVWCMRVLYMPNICPICYALAPILTIY